MVSKSTQKRVEIQQQSKSKEDQQRRESPAGYHYYYSYLENPRNWYLKYVLGLKPRFTPPPLVKGGCLHEAIASYYQNNFSLDAALETYTTEMESREEDYEKPLEFRRDMYVGVEMLTHWHGVWGERDQETYDVIEIERGYEFNIGPGGKLRFTVRPDRVFRDKETGYYYVLDSKTSTWSVDKTIQQADAEDQLTAYIWAMNKAHPEWKVNSAMIDVMYARMSRDKERITSQNSVRSDPIYRTQSSLTIFEMNIVGIIIETTQKVKALATTPWPLLFPRNGRIAGLFSDPYEALSRIDVKPGMIPAGFVKDEWHEVRELVEQIDLDEWIDYSRMKKEKTDV